MYTLLHKQWKNHIWHNHLFCNSWRTSCFISLETVSGRVTLKQLLLWVKKKDVGKGKDYYKSKTTRGMNNSRLYCKYELHWKYDSRTWWRTIMLWRYFYLAGKLVRVDGKVDGAKFRTILKVSKLDVWRLERSFTGQIQKIWWRVMELVRSQQIYVEYSCLLRVHT